MTRDEFVVEHGSEVLTYLIPPGTVAMERVTEWMVAHGVDPGTVPVPSRAVIADGRLTVEQYALDADGNRCVDETGEHAARTTVTVPLVVEPPQCWRSREVSRAAH